MQSADFGMLSEPYENTATKRQRGGSGLIQRQKTKKAMLILLAVRALIFMQRTTKKAKRQQIENRTVYTLIFLAQAQFFSLQFSC